MKSIGKMLERISGMVGTKDLSEWESNFVFNVFDKYAEANRDSSTLSAKQVEIIERIHNKHFAGG